MPENCFHCQQTIPDDLQVLSDIEGKQRSFCCIACQSVCEAIYRNGMDGFYQRANLQQKLQPPPEIEQQLEIYDLDEIQQDYVHLENGHKTVQLLVEGIHCAACVWLIEQRTQQLMGVLEANVNLSQKKVSIRWDDEQIKLSQIMSSLGEIGYAAIPFDAENAEKSYKKQNRDMLFRLGFAAFSAMNLMWISIALYAGADSGKFVTLFYWISMALATPTLLYSGYPFFKGAISGIINRHLTMDLPIAIGATISYLYSCYAMMQNTPEVHVYFDTVVNFIFVILGGRYLEAMSKRGAVQSTQRIIDLQPKIATRIEADEEKVIPVRALSEGDIILIKSGERIAADGIIIEGKALIDESMLSGENFPKHKLEGDMVSAGTTSKEGVIKIRVNKTLKDSKLGKIIHLVDEAQASKAPIQSSADKIVPWFVSLTLLLATITFIFWFNYSGNFEHAIMAATSVLIITCPCAFGLATPMSIAVATGVAASKGILIKNGAVLETLSAIRNYIFDKTGTLTQGMMKVSALYSLDKEKNIIQNDSKNSELLNKEQKKLLKLAALLEKNSDHLIAKAITDYAIQLNLITKNQISSEFNSITPIMSKGICADYHEQKLSIGSLQWLHETNKISEEVKQQLEDELQEYMKFGSSIIGCHLDGESTLIYVISDELRKESADVITQMQAQSLNVTLLSGDKQQVAEHIAHQLNINDVQAEVLPDEKESFVRKIQQKETMVAMVGDGINDAPALVRADVGIAMGTGTDVSIDSADVILINSELNKIPLAAEISSATLSTIKQNIGISIIYNVIMVPVAMAALVTPLVAAIAMPISSLLVIANAARIRYRFKEK